MTKLEVAPYGDRALRFTRRFDAPRALVWRAMTDPALVPQWLWARDYPMSTCEMDVREGGAFRWGWHMPPDREMIVNGRFVELVPVERIVHTELFEDDWTGGETTVTTLLHEDGGATLMEMIVLYSSAEAREGAARTPMAEGMEEGYEKLDRLLPEWT